MKSWASSKSARPYSAPILGRGRGASVTDARFQQALATAGVASVVAAVVGWKAIMLPRATWQLQRMGEDDWEPDDQRHPILKRLEAPTPWHSGADLLIATLTDWCIRGESYWVPSNTNAPLELWWRRASSMEPKCDITGQLSHYEYRAPGGRVTQYAPDEVIAIRFGQDAESPWRGQSPLASLGPEVWTDQEAARATAVTLKNMGIVGMVVSPAGDKDTDITPDDIQRTRNYLREEYSGEKRGETMVLGFPANIDYPRRGGGDASHKAIHDWAEERVCAVLRVPAAVIGFGPGLEQTKVGATMAVLEKQAWRTGLLPDATMIAAAVGRQLLPMFGLDPEAYRLVFDTSGIAELQSDGAAEAAKWQTLVSAGVATRGEARAAFGLDVDEAADDVFLLPLSIVEVGRTQFLEEDEPDPEPPSMPPGLMPPKLDPEPSSMPPGSDEEPEDDDEEPEDDDE